MTINARLMNRKAILFKTCSTDVILCPSVSSSLAAEIKEPTFY